MKIGAYCIFDSVAGLFMQPFLSPAQGVAIRQFGDAVRDQSGPMGKHPGDYRLARLGIFDDETGNFIQEGPPVFVSDGLDHVQGAPNLALQA